MLHIGDSANHIAFIFPQKMAQYTPHTPVLSLEDASSSLPPLQLPPSPFTRRANAKSTPEGTAASELINMLSQQLSDGDVHIAPPVEHASPEITSREKTRPRPIDPVMPPLPIDENLQPARNYVLPNRGVSAAAQRSVRADLIATETPFPQAATQAAPQTTPPVAPQTVQGHQSVQSPLTVETRQATEAASHPTDSIANIFGPPASKPNRQDEIEAQLVAQVAATPAAWTGHATHLDDEGMMIWNAAGTSAPLAPTIAAMIAPAPPVASSAASRVITTTPLSAGPLVAPASRRLSSPLRMALLIATPAIAGIGIAFAIERFLL